MLKYCILQLATRNNGQEVDNTLFWFHVWHHGEELATMLDHSTELVSIKIVYRKRQKLGGGGSGTTTLPPENFSIELASQELQ